MRQTINRKGDIMKLPLEIEIERDIEAKAKGAELLAIVTRQRDEARAEVERLRGILADINGRANKLCESVERLQALMRGDSEVRPLIFDPEHYPEDAKKLSEQRGE
jgi:hypothetical protein